MSLGTNVSELDPRIGKWASMAEASKLETPEWLTELAPAWQSVTGIETLIPNPETDQDLMPMLFQLANYLQLSRPELKKTGKDQSTVEQLRRQFGPSILPGSQAIVDFLANQEMLAKEISQDQMKIIEEKLSELVGLLEELKASWELKILALKEEVKGYKKNRGDVAQELEGAHHQVITFARPGQTVIDQEIDRVESEIESAKSQVKAIKAILRQLGVSQEEAEDFLEEEVDLNDLTVQTMAA